VDLTAVDFAARLPPAAVRGTLVGMTSVRPPLLPPGPQPTTGADAVGGRASLAEVAEVVAGHQRMVWRYLRLLGADPHEADDRMQDTFVVHASRPPDAPAPRHLGAWLRGIARKLLLADRRRTRRHPPTAQWADAVDALLAADPTVGTDARLDALRECLGQLTGRAQQAVQWHHVDGLPRREVADRLGLGDEGAKSLLTRTRELLRECVRRRLGTEEPR
jgi:RNA polymerase sigma-70 factor (ECF subfamily)